MEKERKAILTVRDFQQEYGVAKNTAYDFVNQKGFPAIRFGRTIRIPRKALEQWLAKQFESQENESPSAQEECETVELPDESGARRVELITEQED